MLLIFFSLLSFLLFIIVIIFLLVLAYINEDNFAKRNGRHAIKSNVTNMKKY